MFERVEWVGGELHLRLYGRMDAEAVAELRPLLEHCSTSQPSVLVACLDQVDFIDSAGVGALAFLCKSLRARGSELLLQGLRGQPADLLAALRVDRMIPVRDARVGREVVEPVAVAA